MTDGLVAELARELGSGSEARWLVEEVDQQHPDATEEHRRFALRALVERRMAGVPLQYVLGHWAFRSLDLVVDPRVLIPRPETEQVVEMALAQLPIVAAGRPDPVVVDLGTGSGAVALALLTEGRVAYRELGVWATDIDPDALDVAALNLARSVPPDSVRHFVQALPRTLVGRSARLPARQGGPCGEQSALRRRARVGGPGSRGPSRALSGTGGRGRHRRDTRIRGG